MNINEFKENVVIRLNDLVDEWFDQNTLNDKLFNGIARTIIDSNKNKFDGYINLVTDENGDVMVNALVDNIVGILPEKIEIDLKKYINMPFIPNKILILTKNDITQIIKGND